MIPAERAHLKVAAHTHPGQRGKNNEDRFGVAAYQLAENDPTPCLLAIVSDGIGGHRAGEVAAEIAVNEITRIIAASDPGEPVISLEQALIQASHTIHQHAEDNSEQAGMGATCVAAWIIGDRLHIVSVGDSRMYLLRNGEIQQLTTDHTWIQEAIETGMLTPEQAQGHPNQHVIRRYLGAGYAIEPDTGLRLHPGEDEAQRQANQGERLLPGDTLLLCTDGLSDLVQADEIRQALLAAPNQAPDLDHALHKLTDLANQRGGHDNITTVALHVPRSPFDVETVRMKATQPITEVRTRPRPAVWSGLGGLAALVIILVLAGLLVVLILILRGMFGV